MRRFLSLRLPTLWRKLLRDLGQRKLSIGALAAIIAVGVGVFVGSASVFRDLDGARARYYRGFRLSQFSIDLKRLPDQAIARAQEHPNVVAVRGRISLPVRIELAGVLDPIAGTALSLPADRRPVIDDCLLVSGRWFSGERAQEAILIHAFARENRIRPGDEIRVTLLDRQHRLRVVGTAMSPEFVYLLGGGGLAPDPARFGVVYLPRELLAESADLAGACNQLVGWVDDATPQVLERTLDDLERALDRYGVTTTTPASQRASVQFLADELRGLQIQSRVMPSIFLGVAALVLNLLISRMVSQQRTTLGVLRAVGRSRAEIVLHVLASGAAVGVLGLVGGVALGRWIQTAMIGLYRQYYEMPGIEARVYVDVLLLGGGIALVCALIGTLGGARHAASLAPAVAMRPPPPERGGRTIFDWIPGWSRAPLVLRIASRHIARNPVRSGTTVLSTLVATALIATTLNNLAAMDEMIRYTFRVLARQDVTIALREAVDVRAARELETLPTLTEVEPQLGVAAELTGPGGSKRVGVTGLMPDARMFVPRDALDRPIGIPRRGLVLSRKLAQLLGAEPGATVRLRTLQGRREQVEAPVVAVVDTYMGLGAYADLRYLSRLIGETPTANTYLARREPGADRAPLMREVVRRPGVVGVDERTRAITQLEETIGATIGGFIAVTVLFSGAVGFGSTLNATLVALSERQREVATYRVLGYSTGQVTMMLSLELLTLGVLGIGLGLLAGIGLSAWIVTAFDTELFRFPLVIEGWRLAVAAGTMACFLALSQLVVYRLISRLDWLEALSAKE